MQRSRYSLEAGDTRIVFGTMNKERLGFSRERNRKVHPKTPRALSGAPLSLEAMKYSAEYRRAQDRLWECICYQMW